MLCNSLPLTCSKCHMPSQGTLFQFSNPNNSKMDKYDCVLRRDDIIFRDPMNALAGIENYKSVFWGLRFHGRIFFRALWVNIVSVCSPWRRKRSWCVGSFNTASLEFHGGAAADFDGTSEYKLDKDCKIYEHKFDNIAVNGPQKHLQQLTVEQLIQLIGCPSTPKPTYFQSSSSSPITHI